MQRSARVDHVAFVYIAHVPAGRAPEAYTARAIPYDDEASVPLEAREILWQR